MRKLIVTKGGEKVVEVQFTGEITVSPGDGYEFKIVNQTPASDYPGSSHDCRDNATQFDR